jgi:hypothetical protein
MIGFVIYAFLYLLFHNSDIAAGVGMTQLALHVTLKGGSVLEVGFIVLVLLFVPFKKWLDRPHRQAIKGGEEGPLNPEVKSHHAK